MAKFDQFTFDKLKKELRNDWHLRVSSNLQDTYEHPAYQKVIEAGKQALPYILRDLRDTEPMQRFWWFHAIDEIVGQQKSPKVPDHVKGHMPILTEIYLKWGREQGYLT